MVLRDQEILVFCLHPSTSWPQMQEQSQEMMAEWEEEGPGFLSGVKMGCLLQGTEKYWGDPRVERAWEMALHQWLPTAGLSPGCVWIWLNNVLQTEKVTVDYRSPWWHTWIESKRYCRDWKETGGWHHHLQKTTLEPNLTQLTPGKTEDQPL